MIIYADGIDLEVTIDDSLPAVTPFSGLRVAGHDLATRLESYRGRDDVIVLALVLGGVLVGHEVASQLGLPFDYVILRRLFAPNGPGFPVCAVNVAGNLEFVGDVPPRPEVPVTGLDYFLRDTLAQLEEREKICRGGRPPRDLAGKTILLVDCGMRTGSTMMTAMRAVRSGQPAKLVVAQPVASLGATELVKPEADEFVCLGYPRPFGNVAVWYKDFTRPEENQISDLLK
ncbi:MAG TPA: phosphoribosyltransferase family protein [Pyrinomonadaceae bacterium]|jgi:predicted phosphoribosyltransferase|nr:phosphoribosyltransferase family protein [Pyrinomonadaceae bacterium]